jgi:hypothetical protein
MKNFLLAVLLAATTSLSAQLTYDEWERQETVDEFGDPTGNSVDRIFLHGRFSNSATTGSDLTVKVVLWSDGNVSIDLYEYDRSPATLCSGCSGRITVKLPDGSLKTISAWGSSKGGLLFSAKKGKESELLTLINQTSGELKFNIDESNFSTYGRSRYSFVLKGRATPEESPDPAPEQ